MSTKTPKFYVKNKKGKWLASDSVNRNYNKSCVKFVTKKNRSVAFDDILNAENWRKWIEYHYSMETFIIEE